MHITPVQGKVKDLRLTRQVHSHEGAGKEVWICRFALGYVCNSKQSRLDVRTLYFKFSESITGNLMKMKVVGWW